MVATIMREVLKALEYVHRQGGIHRDIKVRIEKITRSKDRGIPPPISLLMPSQAGNILVDKDGTTYLADFGVATDGMERNGSWGHDKANRMTFVGTPCWMAPEVMEQTAGWVIL